MPAGETEILAVGIQYLRLEGSLLHCGIGRFFLLYGLYRGLERAPDVHPADRRVPRRARGAGLRARVHPADRPAGHLVGDPIGWLLADLTGFLWYGLRRERLLSPLVRPEQ